MTPWYSGGTTVTRAGATGRPPGRTALKYEKRRACCSFLCEHSTTHIALDEKQSKRLRPIIIHISCHIGQPALAAATISSAVSRHRGITISFLYKYIPPLWREVPHHNHSHSAFVAVVLHSPIFVFSVRIVAMAQSGDHGAWAGRADSRVTRARCEKVIGV